MKRKEKNIKKRWFGKKILKKGMELRATKKRKFEES